MVSLAPKQPQFLFSYVPLFDYKKAYKNPAKAMEIVAKAKSPNVAATIWAIENEQASPILVMDNAKKLANHMTEWSDNKPEDWFKLIYGDDGKNFHQICIMADMNKSKVRYNIKALQERTQPLGDNFTIITKPITFTSQSITQHYNFTYQNLQNQEKVKLCFYEEKDLKASDDINKMLNPRKIIEVCEVPIINANTALSKFSDAYIYAQWFKQEFQLTLKARGLQ
jgi:hypothetical protein